jgi:hypothetical protein
MARKMGMNIQYMPTSTAVIRHTITDVRPVFMAWLGMIDIRTAGWCDELRAMCKKLVKPYMCQGCG